MFVSFHAIKQSTIKLIASLISCKLFEKKNLWSRTFLRHFSYISLLCFFSARAYFFICSCYELKHIHPSLHDCSSIFNVFDHIRSNEILIFVLFAEFTTITHVMTIFCPQNTSKNKEKRRYSSDDDDDSSDDSRSLVNERSRKSNNEVKFTILTE